MNTSEIFLYLFIYLRFVFAHEIQCRFVTLFRRLLFNVDETDSLLTTKPTIDWLSLRGKYLAFKGCKIIILKEFHRFKLGPKQSQSHGIDLASTSLQTILSLQQYCLSDLAAGNHCGGVWSRQTGI